MKLPTAVAWRAMLVCAIAQAASTVAAGTPLHALIDQHLVPDSGISPKRCSDAEFLRRVSLDLVGVPPTSDEARKFISDTLPNKREQLVDRLFSSPHYPRHLASKLNLMLMERRANTHVSADEWRAWLVNSVRQNKPWNVLAREILTADGEDPAQRPAARFALDRASDPNVITRDIGRIFFGRDMQCAQCHDHPLVDDYLQSDYQGLLAFVAPSYAMPQTRNGVAVTVQAEKAGSDVTFESVFVGTKRRTGPRMPRGIVIDEPFLLPGDEYQVAPADNVKPVPKFSRRAKLAEMATSGANEAFNRNAANRLWAHMFGRGLVHPVDMHHPENPPTEPELLQILADQFVAMNFDMRAFLREIALSGAYQRAFDLPSELMTLSAQAAEQSASLQAERAAMEQASAESADAYTAAADVWQEKEAAMLPAAAELDTARNQYAEAKKKVEEALKAVIDATVQLQAKMGAAAPVQQAAAAAQAAARLLPADKTLADAAQKLAAKSKQMTSEVNVATKEVEEKTAAIAPTTQALGGLKGTIDSALGKVTLIEVAMKDAERNLLAARRKMAVDTESLMALERKIETARQSAKLAQLDQSVKAAKEAVGSRAAELAAAEKHFQEFAPVVAAQEAKSKSAADAVAATDKALQSARAEHKSRAAAVNTIAAALASADAARHIISGDVALAEVATKLQRRVEESQTQRDASQARVEAATAAHKSADESFVAAHEALGRVLAERARREQAWEAAKQALAVAQSDLAARQSSFDASLNELTDRWSNDFTISALKPLSPEQLCWSVFRVTGVYERYWQAEVAELDKTKPLSEEQKKDPAQLAAREIELEQRTFDKLKGNEATFVAFYGAAAGQPQGDFFSTADQALFAANGGAINSWVAPAADNVAERIVKQEDLRAAAEELYLAVLTRMPKDDEAAEVVAHLTDRKADKAAAAQELVWALLNSAEFRFNH
jgi:hypothetical protein